MERRTSAVQSAVVSAVAQSVTIPAVSASTWSLTSELGLGVNRFENEDGQLVQAPLRDKFAGESEDKRERYAGGDGFTSSAVTTGVGFHGPMRPVFANGRNFVVGDYDNGFNQYPGDWTKKVPFALFGLCNFGISGGIDTPYENNPGWRTSYWRRFLQQENYFNMIRVKRIDFSMTIGRRSRVVDENDTLSHYAFDNAYRVIIGTVDLSGSENTKIADHATDHGVFGTTGEFTGSHDQMSTYNFIRYHLGVRGFESPVENSRVQVLLDETVSIRPQVAIGRPKEYHYGELGATYAGGPLQIALDGDVPSTFELGEAYGFTNNHGNFWECVIAPETRQFNFSVDCNYVTEFFMKEGRPRAMYAMNNAIGLPLHTNVGHRFLETDLLKCMPFVCVLNRNYCYYDELNSFRDIQLEGGKNFSYYMFGAETKGNRTYGGGAPEPPGWYAQKGVDPEDLFFGKSRFHCERV